MVGIVLCSWYNVVFNLPPKYILTFSIIFSYPVICHVVVSTQNGFIYIFVVRAIFFFSTFFLLFLRTGKTAIERNTIF